MTRKKRKKIEFCYTDYLTTISEEEGREYRNRFAPLIEIIRTSRDDQEIMARAGEYDAAHGTDLFAEAVNLKVYCVACHRVDCIC